MNPWAIVGLLLMLAGSYFGGHHQGYKAGANEQAVADKKLVDAEKQKVTEADKRTQGIIDGYNKQITEQKAAAASKAIDQRDQVIALQSERDGFKKRLGDEHVKNQELTDRNADLLSAYSLRFRAQPENSGCGYGAGPCEGAQGGSSGDAGASIVQLPAALESDLRKLVKDADELNDDYKFCYGYAQQIEPAKPEK